MIRKLWRTYVTRPRYLRGCADYGFVPNPELDALCERFNDTCTNMWYAMADLNCHHLSYPLSPEPAELRVKVDDLLAVQKSIQSEGDAALYAYLAPYFAIVDRHKAGEWGIDNPPLIPGGHQRFRTAYNWRD